MYQKSYSRRFKRSVKRIVRSGQISRELIENVISDLSSGNILNEKYHDHPLAGKWKGSRECHIRPDLLLVYRIDEGVLVLLLIDMGSHSQLFG